MTNLLVPYARFLIEYMMHALGGARNVEGGRISKGFSDGQPRRHCDYPPVVCPPSSLKDPSPIAFCTHPPRPNTAKVTACVAMKPLGTSCVLPARITPWRRCYGRDRMQARATLARSTIAVPSLIAPAVHIPSKKKQLEGYGSP